MGLAHFTNVDTGRFMWEPIFKSLFEITIQLPNLVATNLGGQSQIGKVLLENATSVTLPEYPKIEVKPQRFKYSTRVYPTLPAQTHLTEQTIKFNLNESVPVADNLSSYITGKVPTFRAIKDWYDLIWNNETGQLNYKGNLYGQVIIDQHDKEGLVVRRIIWHDAMLTAFSGWAGEISWENYGDIMDLSASFAVDYWEDYYY